MEEVSVYLFDAYDITLSLVRQDAKNPDFGTILLTFSINWWWEGVPMGYYGVKGFSNTFLLKVVQKNLLRGWVGVV